jgi:hypothetical protein
MLGVTLALLMQLYANDASLLEDNLLTCVAAISERHFMPGSTVAFSFPGDENLMITNDPHEYILHTENRGQYINSTNNIEQLLRQLHDKIKWPIIVSQPNGLRTSNHVHDKHKFYILWASVNLTMQLHHLKSYGNAWNPRARFLVVLERIMRDPRYLIMEILEELRQWKILNVVVLVQFSIRSDTLDIYTWFPYQQPSGKCGKLQDIILWNQWDVNKGHFLRNISLFPSKIPSNLGQCRIVASTMTFEPYVMPNTTTHLNITYKDGLEVLLFHFVTNAMNLKVNFRPPPPQNELWGQELTEGIWTGIRGNVINETADVAFCAMSLRSMVSQYVDGTKPYINGGIVWVVPCARKKPRWKSILLVFSSSTWILILAAVFFSSIIMFYLEKFELKRQENPKLSYGSIIKCLTYSWAVLLGIVVPQMPRNILLRLFFTFWVSYSLAVNTVFQTFVTSYLVDPGMLKQIKSFDEIHETGMKYGFYPGLDRALQDGSDWQAVEIMAHRKACNDVINCLKAVYKSTEFATLTDRLHVSYLNTHTFLDKSGVPMLCTIEYDFIESHKAFLLTKGNHLLKQFNKFIEIALQAGLVGKWWKDIQVTSRIKAAAIRKYSPLNHYSVLLLTHLQGAYFLLLLGHCVAFICFLMEKLCHKHYTQESLYNTNIFSRSND